jgi:hypothetical protein
MSEFAKSSPNLDRLIASLHSPEDIRQACKNEFERRGLIPNSNETSAQPAAPGPVDSGWGFSRVIYVGNSRFELEASSEEGLDDQEARIRAAFGQR